MIAATGAAAGAAGLLERSITYMLGNLVLVTPATLARPTPCEGWDLRTLLVHVDDALSALAEAVETGRVTMPAIENHQDPIDGVRATARRVIEGWSTLAVTRSVRIDRLAISPALVAAAGGIEIAAHGWDIARAAGWRRPVPPALAEEMLDLLPLLLTDASRGCRFAAAVSVPENACAGDKLIANLGRHHLMIAIAIACVSIIPLALTAGPVRHLPFWWSCVDMSFGVFGLVPLLFLHHYIRLRESRETSILVAAAA
jgi:uncharacterized protein (TIGR03086 family)